MSIVQIAFIGLTGVLTAVWFGETKKEYSILIMIAVSILIFFFTVTKLGQIIKTIEFLENKLNISAVYAEILVKIVGISFICEFAADICKDSGFGAVSNQIQIFGKIAVLVVSMPVFLKLFDLIGGLM